MADAGIFGLIFGLIAGLLPLIILGLLVVTIAGVIFLIYFMLKKHFEKVDLFTPRQVTFTANIEASLLLRNPFMKDLWLSGDGKTPHQKIGDIAGFNAEPSKLKSISDEEALKLGVATIYTFIFRDTSGVWKKIFPTLKALRVFQKDVVDGNLLGSILIAASGVKKKGYYYFPTTYGNYDSLYLEHLNYEAMETSYEKSQDKWGEFADLNIKQKQPFLMDVERGKTTLEMPFGKKGEKG